MLRNKADVRRCSHFELGLPVYRHPRTVTAVADWVHSIGKSGFKFLKSGFWICSKTQHEHFFSPTFEAPKETKQEKKNVRFSKGAPVLGSPPRKAQNKVKVRLSEVENENIQSELHTRRIALNVRSSETVSLETR